jgi:hypothetical protein
LNLACTVSDTCGGVEVRNGENITSLIAELELLAREHPSAYAGYIAHHVPEMSRLLHNSPEWIADYLITLCGKPARSARQLWAIWQRIPEPSGPQPNTRAPRAPAPDVREAAPA